MKNWLSENIVVAVLGAVLAWLGWSNRSQLETISLKQDKAILQSQADAENHFVSKTWYQAENASLHAADSQNSAAIVQVAGAVAEMKTDIAVIKTEVQRKNFNPQN